MNKHHLFSIKSIVLFICIISGIYQNLEAQSYFDRDSIPGVTSKDAGLHKFSIGGSYRFFAQHRMMTEEYITSRNLGVENTTGKRSILLGDASQLPELTLNINGSPNNKTSFGTDVVVWNQNNGNFDYYRGLQLGLNMYGSFQTDYGNANVRVGGIHWHKMTPFTFKSFEGYNRFSLYDRNPWDPISKNPMDRYDEYYERGAITQDVRWGSQAFQGLIADFSELPLGLTGSVLYGKTQLNGGFENDIPDYSYGGQLSKKYKKFQVSFNTLQSRSYEDSLAQNPLNYGITSALVNFQNKRFTIISEIGTGKYMDNERGEAISFKAIFNKKTIGFPFEINYYRISPNVYNNNSEILNTSIIESQSANVATSQTVIGNNGVLRPTGSSMVGIGQMTNNRQAIAINADINLRENLKIIIGNSIEQELQNGSQYLTYGHTINNVTMSRFWRWAFPSNVGPYGRKNVIFRGVYEKANFTNVNENGVLEDKLSFNTIESQLKYQFKVKQLKFNLFYLGSYASAQNKLSPITIFNESAFLRNYTHQGELYVRISQKIVLIGYYGRQRVIGNYDIDVNEESRRPRNQDGQGIGTGCDIQLSKNTVLFFRHKWIQFVDTSFELDKFKGKEATLELKTYF